MAAPLKVLAACSTLAVPARVPGAGYQHGARFNSLVSLSS